MKKLVLWPDCLEAQHSVRPAELGCAFAVLLRAGGDHALESSSRSLSRRALQSDDLVIDELPGDKVQQEQPSF